MSQHLTPARIFAKPSLAQRVEQLVFGLLRLATYFVLACAAVIFLDIGIKGGAVVFRAKAPFINVPFLTEKPETLNVFELHGTKRTMGDREFRVFKEQHTAELKDVHVESYVYSAGGIFPNIVGTVLLVIGSITIEAASALALNNGSHTAKSSAVNFLKYASMCAEWQNSVVLSMVRCLVSVISSLSI